MNSGAPKVFLNTIDESDLDFWEDLLQESSSREHQPLKFRTAEELSQELDRYSESDLSHPTHRAYKWVAVNEADGKKMGVISFDKLDLSHRIGRIGYTISLKFTGRGWATEAVREAVRRIFTESATERIEAECSVNNLASSRVLEKNGFGLEGVKRGYLILNGQRVDHFSYGLLKSHWQEAE